MLKECPPPAANVPRNACACPASVVSSASSSSNPFPIRVLGACIFRCYQLLKPIYVATAKSKVRKNLVLCE
jgi:hypothetical protein